MRTTHENVECSLARHMPASNIEILRGSDYASISVPETGDADGECSETGDADEECSETGDADEECYAFCDTDGVK